MPTLDLSEQVAAELVEFCWGQWTQMGVSGEVTRRDPWAADPEALLLFSLPIARRDPRLFDEILDWLAMNGRLISAQRIKNLSRQDPEARRLAAASLAWAADHNPALRPLASESGGTEEGEREPLFRTSGGRPGTRKNDAGFLSWGFTRPPLEPSLKSRPPDLTAPVNMAFRLRLLLGVGARSEVVRYLLVSDDSEVNTHQVARAAGFAKRNVSETLVALADAGVVNARWRANERVFKTDPRRWLDLLHFAPHEMPVFVDWICLFRALLEIARWLESGAGKVRSEYVRASEARGLIDRIGRDLLAAGVTVPDARAAMGPGYWPVFEGIVEAALGRLRPAA
ncbi:MAG: hypothetical protein WDA71_05765 [Actinomycetota bacterium]